MRQIGVVRLKILRVQCVVGGGLGRLNGGRILSSILKRMIALLLKKVQKRWLSRQIGDRLLTGACLLR